MNVRDKMSVPAVLKVYSLRVIAPLQIKSAKYRAESIRSELQSLVNHLEIGHARFEVARLQAINCFCKTRLSPTVLTYEKRGVKIMRMFEPYYERKFKHESMNTKSAVWYEMLYAYSPRN